LSCKEKVGPVRTRTAAPGPDLFPNGLLIENREVVAHDLDEYEKKQLDNPEKKK